MATAEKLRTAEIHDIGPIDHLVLPVPEGGGVVVLRGPNGAGKTTAIEAVATAATGKGKLSVKDGAERGEVRLGEVTLKVGKTQRTVGDRNELGFQVLSGRYTIADLIAPGYKDRAACDEHAIKTLAQLAGSGDESLFYELVGGAKEFSELCPDHVAGDLDVVALAGRVERALQKRARDEEALATGADSKADAYSAASRDVDVTAECDSDKLQASLERAIGAEARLKQQAADAASKIAAANEAKAALEDAEHELKGKSVAECEAAVTESTEVVGDCLQAVVVAEHALEAAQRTLDQSRSDLTQARTNLTHAGEALQAARSNEQLFAKFRNVVAEGEIVEEIPAEQLDAAKQAVIAARQAVEQGAIIRKAKEAATEAQQWRAKAGEHRKRADGLRDAASGTDEVLSGLVARLGTSLFVKRGRLMVKSDRGEESFWELSDGERSEIAVTVFATHVGANGLLALPQSFWEGLDWAGRKRIAEHVKKVGVVAITAECDSEESAAGELRAEVFQG